MTALRDGRARRAADSRSRAPSTARVVAGGGDTLRRGTRRTGRVAHRRSRCGPTARRAPYGADADAVRAELAAPDRRARCGSSTQIEAMYAAGARVFVEAGPGQVLTGLVGQILGDRPHLAVACEPPARAAACAACSPRSPSWPVAGRAGATPAGCSAAATPSTVPGRAAPERPGWTVDGQLVRDRARQPPARRPGAGPTHRGDVDVTAIDTATTPRRRTAGTS